MIHVTPRPEPNNFDRDVRQKGLRHLRTKGFALDQPLPAKAKVTPHWRASLDDLYTSYEGICAYLSVHFERVTGGASVEHFIAKSSDAGLIYEWSNYRLATMIVNSRKNAFDDVLDPFEVENGSFHLELVSGRIFPDPQLDNTIRDSVQATINRLGLDDPEIREMRARHFTNYIQREVSATYLRRYSPFVYMEADRQGLL